MVSTLGASGTITFVDGSLPFGKNIIGFFAGESGPVLSGASRLAASGEGTGAGLRVLGGIRVNVGPVEVVAGAATIGPADGVVGAGAVDGWICTTPPP